MSRAAPLALLLAACSVDVAARPAGQLELEPAETETDGYDPALDVLEHGRAGEGVALEAAVAHFRAHAPGYADVEVDPELRVGWVAGVECPYGWPAKPGVPYLDNGSFCSNGATYSCERIYIVLRDGQTIAESPYAHELAHCMSTLAGLGMDHRHTGRIWAQVAGADAAIAAALGESR